MHTIAIANQKGGVGKTTTVINLAGALGRRDFRVLIVDMDPQHNATVGTIGRRTIDQPSTAHVLTDRAQLADIILSTGIPNVWIAPGSKALSAADLEIAGKLGREKLLSRALRSLPGDSFDFVFFDTSPYLGLLTVNSLLAARHVLIPLSAEFYPFNGLSDLLGTVDELKSAMEAQIAILGFLVTSLDLRIASGLEIVDALVKRFDDQVFSTKIRTNSNLKAIPAHRQDIFQYETDAQRKPWKGVEDFTSLGDEVLRRLGIAPVSTTAAA
jgi:chromosome partitioning protein